MLNFINRLIDRTTMYRLVLYLLCALLGGALALGLFHVIRVDAGALGFSTVLITAVCWGSNLLFARIFKAVPNRESVYITALILALILAPASPANLPAVGLLAFASVWAIGSKFLLSARGRHIFNPAALGVALGGLLLGQPATWWISTLPPLLPIVLIGGLVLVRKIRRFDLVLAFAVANLVATLATSQPADDLGQLKLTLMESPFLFFASVMLTEPLTAPQQKVWRLLYGAVVGVLASPSVHVGGYYFTPEVALLVGNLLAFVVSPRGRVMLTLERMEQTASGAVDFIFRPNRPLAFAAGQYLEWTMPVPSPDNRGNRRYFTIASAPTEEQIRLGVRLYPHGSAFKRELAALGRGGMVVASQLAGSFVLPKDPHRKLAFIAGGIGITPFRSMLKELIDRDQPRPITVLYGNRSASEIAYADVLADAENRLGIRTHHAVVDGQGAPPDMTIGLIDETMIHRCVPDFAERGFYISGPRPMVIAVRRALRRMGVPFWRIKTDFFPGLA